MTSTLISEKMNITVWLLSQVLFQLSTTAVSQERNMKISSTEMYKRRTTSHSGGRPFLADPTLASQFHGITVLRVSCQHQTEAKRTKKPHKTNAQCMYCTSHSGVSRRLDVIKTSFLWMLHPRLQTFPQKHFELFDL